MIVDILVPLRNEESYLPTLLEQLRRQGSSVGQIYLVVGPSTDRTLDIARQAAARDRRLVVLENPAGTAPHAMNIALRASQGDAWMRIDGHTEIPDNLVEAMADELTTRDVACVGPVLRPGSRSPVQAAVGLAMNSPLGVGSARFRTGVGGSGSVDALAFGLYKRSWTDRVGLFNTTMVRNQDDEFNTRLRRAGGVLWLTDRVSVTYFPRATIRGLYRQYREYGEWRAVGTIVFDNELRWRQVVPPLFVAGLAFAAVTSLLIRRAAPAVSAAAGYGAVLGMQVRRARGSGAPLSTAVISAGAVATMHLSYGLGFFAGIARAVVLRRNLRAISQGSA